MNRKVIYISFAASFVVLTLWLFISIPSIPLENQTSQLNDSAELPVFIPQNTQESAESDLIARLHVLEPQKALPEPKVDPEQEKKDSDKTLNTEKLLRPSFALLDDNHQVGLSAIFRSDKTFIVLEKQNFVTQKSEFIKLHAGQELYGFVLKRIDKNSVSFEKAEQKLELTIFN
ncbi:MAG: hypothetical protein ACFHVJ_20250 [Aestuariibacter sp.]